MVTINDLIRRATELFESDFNLLAQARTGAQGKEAAIGRLTMNGAPRWAAEYALRVTIAWFNMIEDDD